MDTHLRGLQLKPTPVHGFQRSTISVGHLLLILLLTESMRNSAEEYILLILELGKDGHSAACGAINPLRIVAGALVSKCFTTFSCCCNSLVSFFPAQP